MMIRVYKVLRIVLPFLALVLGGVKILGHGFEVKVFAQMGVPVWFRVAFGAAQLVCGMVIISPALELAGIFSSIALLLLAAGLMALHGLFALAVVPVSGVLTLLVFAQARRRYLQSI